MQNQSPNTQKVKDTKEESLIKITSMFPDINKQIASNLIDQYKKELDPTTTAANYIFDKFKGQYPKEFDISEADFQSADKLRTLLGQLSALPVIEVVKISEFSAQLSNIVQKELNTIDSTKTDILADILILLLKRIRHSNSNDANIWEAMKNCALQLGTTAVQALDKHKGSYNLIHAVALLFPVKINKFVAQYEQLEDAKGILQDISQMIKMPRSPEFLKGASFAISAFTLVYNNTYSTIQYILNSLANEGKPIGAEQLRVVKRILKPFVIASRLIKQSILMEKLNQAQSIQLSYNRTITLQS
ncbi:MAG: hypothetical protein EZS28_022271, partial [Streblomastix strix]